MRDSTLQIGIRSESEQAAAVVEQLEAHRYSAFDALPLCYAQLFHDVGSENFFLSPPWFSNFVNKIVAPEESVIIYGIESSNRTVALGAIPMWHRVSDGLFRPKVIQSLTNYYTPSWSPILDGRYSVESIEAFSRALAQDRQLFSVADFRCLDPQQPYFATLQRALSDRGFAVQTHFQFGNWYLHVGDRSYAEYVAGLSTVLKKNIPYQARRLERTYRVEFVLTTGLDGLDNALKDYETVYHSSWRDQEAYPGFIRGLVETAARIGSLRLGILYADGIPIAAQLWFIQGGVAAIYKIAYVETFAKFSVGTVLTARMMHNAIDVEKVSIVDYLSGDDGYKKDWMSHRRERWGILAFNLRSFHGLLLAARHLGGRRLKQIWRQMSGVQGITVLSSLMWDKK